MEIVQCSASQQSSNWSYIQRCYSTAAGNVQYINLNVHTVCDVIIARRCGTLPPFAAIIILLLALDCVMQLMNKFMSESCSVFFLAIRQ